VGGFAVELSKEDLAEIDAAFPDDIAVGHRRVVKCFCSRQSLLVSTPRCNRVSILHESCIFLIPTVVLQETVLTHMDARSHLTAPCCRYPESMVQHLHDSRKA